MPTQKQTPITRIQFPEIALQHRDAHKLRGYFGRLFRDESPLLHNHYKDGSLRYKYPAVQYKVIQQIPTLVGTGEGARLLQELFLKIKELNIDGDVYSIHSKNIEHRNFLAGYAEEMIDYQFATRWMGLNSENYSTYQSMRSKTDQKKLLQGILVGHVLNFFKSHDIMLQPTERLLAVADLKPKKAKVKDQEMIAFEGGFSINAELPDYIGLGKFSSRGFGTILQQR